MLRYEPTFLKYLSETRVELDPNQLVDGVWDGLRDRYVLGAFRARSFVDAAFTSPLIFFTHSDQVFCCLFISEYCHLILFLFYRRSLAP